MDGYAFVNHVRVMIVNWFLAYSFPPRVKARSG